MWQRDQRRGGGLRTIVIGGFLAAAVLLAAGALGFSWLGRPFTTETVDRSSPVVLTELRDLADYHAAQAQFSVTVDQERDVKWMPSFVAGERVQFLAVGTVDAVVDFTGLDSSDIVIADDGAVTISLPAPVIQDPVIDHDQSHVMNRDRGVVNRVAGIFSDSPTTEAQLYAAASEKMAEAAASTDLVTRATANTTRMLQALLGALGFSDVTVEFSG